MIRNDVKDERDTDPPGAQFSPICYNKETSVANTLLHLQYQTRKASHSGHPH